MCIAIDKSRWMCENCKRLTENDKKELMEGCDYQKDLIKMITVVTFDRFGVIRDYLYEYLAEKSEGFCLIAKKAPIPTEVGGAEVVTVEQKK